jgi:hypothetical protein
MAKGFIDVSRNASPNLTFADTFIFPADKLNEIINDSSLSKNSYLIFTTENKKLKIANTGKYKFLHEFDMPNVNGGVTVRFGAPLVLAVKNMTDTLEFNASTNYPIKITEKTDISEISIIVAPLVVDEDD